MQLKLTSNYLVRVLVQVQLSILSGSSGISKGI